MLVLPDEPVIWSCSDSGGGLPQQSKGATHQSEVAGSAISSLRQPVLLVSGLGPKLPSCCRPSLLAIAIRIGALWLHYCSLTSPSDLKPSTPTFWTLNAETKTKVGQPAKSKTLNHQHVSKSSAKLLPAKNLFFEVEPICGIPWWRLLNVDKNGRRAKRANSGH